MKGMKSRKNMRRPIKRRSRNLKQKGDPIRSFAFVTVCAVLAVAIAAGSKLMGNGEPNAKVYAASVPENAAAGQDEDQLPTGIAGVVSGVQETMESGNTVKRIGTACERVMVGQRLKTVTNEVAELNVSTFMEQKVNDLDSKSIMLAESPKIMSDTDYETLLRIVEAEAGGEDVKGRILVANVIMNRVKNEGFPNTVTEVVWEYSDGVPQFSPTYDGRIGEVTVSEDTRTAVKQALEGVDYSEGALFFIQKSAAEDHNVKWFEKDLKKLFKYGVHEFYTYPEESETVEMEEGSEKAEDNIVQMVKR